MPISTHSDERLLRFMNEHWIKYMLPSLFYILLLSVSGLLFYLSQLIAHHSMWLSHGVFLAAFLLLLCSHHWFFQCLLSEYLSQIIVTNRRAITFEQSILFKDDMKEIPFHRVHAVEAREHGLLQNVLHYGSIWFDIGETIDLVPHPHRVVQDILEILESQPRIGRVHEVPVGSPPVDASQRAHVG